MKKGQKKGQKYKKEGQKRGTKAWDKIKQKTQKRGTKTWDKKFKARDKSVEQKRATKACHPSKTEILDVCKNDQKSCVLLHKVNSSHGLVPRIGPTDWFLFFEIPSLFFEGSIGSFFGVVWFLFWFLWDQVVLFLVPLGGQLVPFWGLFGSFFGSFGVNWFLFWFLWGSIGSFFGSFGVNWFLFWGCLVPFWFLWDQVVLFLVPLGSIGSFFGVVWFQELVPRDSFSSRLNELVPRVASTSCFHELVFHELVPRDSSSRSSTGLHAVRWIQKPKRKRNRKTKKNKKIGSTRPLPKSRPEAGQP